MRAKAVARTRTRMGIGIGIVERGEQTCAMKSGAKEGEKKRDMQKKNKKNKRAKQTHQESALTA